jgi:hypothetical protein
MRIRDADAVMMSASRKIFIKTEHMTSAQLVNPSAQCTSRGQKKETDELVNKRSAIMWERITRKQLQNPILGILE